MVNLLANAHGHTPRGTRIAITGRIMDAQILLAVQDHGPGISVAEQARIFQRFYRGTTTAEGSGLGLAIAQGFVELHAGRIWVESQLGKGTTFYVALPYTMNGAKL